MLFTTACIWEGAAWVHATSVWPQLSLFNFRFHLHIPSKGAVVTDFKIGESVGGRAKIRGVLSFVPYINKKICIFFIFGEGFPVSGFK